jgi:fermentation-respiration switch protein FrsA (DUF1100 family)
MPSKHLNDGLLSAYSAARQPLRRTLTTAVRVVEMVTSKRLAPVQKTLHPNSTFKYTTSSLLDLMRFDATNQIELINQPLLMIAGSKADSLYMPQDAFPKATGTQDKELFIIDGATHIETYWVPEYVDAALGKLAPFYARLS